MPPMPMAASRLIAPVGIASTRTFIASDPIFMMEPLPQFFSICAMARFNAFFLSSCAAEVAMPSTRKLSVDQLAVRGRNVPPPPPARYPNKIRRFGRRIKQDDRPDREPGRRSPGGELAPPPP